MSTNNDILTPYVSIGLTRFCKYCGKPISKHEQFCDCEDGKKLKDVNHQILKLEIERIKLTKSAPPARFTAATRLVPTSEYEPYTEPDDEPPVNV